MRLSSVSAAGDSIFLNDCNMTMFFVRDRRVLITRNSSLLFDHTVLTSLDDFGKNTLVVVTE